MEQSIFLHTMEKESVHKIYSTIAKHFDSTRYSLWKGVKAYLESLTSGSTLLDIGCGNGKYLSVRKDCLNFGCDTCPELIEIAKEKHKEANVLVANGRCLPYGSNSFDAVYSVAVLHHISTEEGRREFLKEMIRVWNRNQPGFLSVWSVDAVKPSWRKLGGKGDYMVPWTNKDDNKVYERYYHVFEKEELEGLFKEYIDIREIHYELENWYVIF
jgi:tRNA (uracil-5-)-methyltransferase TRM9